MQRKIFVVSLHRSATQSTDLFLRNAGLNTCHWPSIVDGIRYELKCLGSETAPEKIVEVLRPVFDGVDAVSDVPIPAIYEELDATYPDAKFVAVYRNPTDWVQSVRRHTRSENLGIYERVLYWRYLHNKPMTLDDVPDDVLANLHRLHHEGLITHFKHRNNFLLVDIVDPAIAEKILSFLEITSSCFPRFDYTKISLIADLHREIDRLREQYDTLSEQHGIVYRFSLARIQNKVRRMIGSRNTT